MRREESIDAALGPGRFINRYIAAGESAERELDQFIAHRHDKRALSEGERLEEALFRANERRAQEKRRQERHAGLLAKERHLRSVYFRLYKEKDESVAFLEGRAPEGAA
jgi:hypothetical protein